jgi:hypothetical protein
VPNRIRSLKRVLVLLVAAVLGLIPRTDGQHGDGEPTNEVVVSPTEREDDGPRRSTSVPQSRRAVTVITTTTQDVSHGGVFLRPM